MEMKSILTGASLLMKAGIAGIMLVISGIIAYFCISADSGYVLVCLGPFGLIFFIFFVICIVWILGELKEIYSKPKD